jgi:GntR family transcriptional regulator/MocR family aminotransferase
MPFDPSGLQLTAGRGLVRQLYEQLRERVLDGRLEGGVRLPASRDLARALAVSRNTVIGAYEQLCAEGFTQARIGDGTYIAMANPLPVATSPKIRSSTGLSTAFEGGIPTTLSTDSAVVSSSTAAFTPALRQAMAPVMAPPKTGAPRAFQVGVPAFDLFPFGVWAKLYSDFWRTPNPAALGYQDPAGHLALREMIAAYLRSSRGLACTADQIVITCGAQQGISLCAQLLLQAGDCAAMENPGYRAAGHALASVGARLAGIGVDEEGLRCNDLADLTDCRLVYVTPAHQYPTGVTLSLARRFQLLEWARRSGAWILEDDYDGEYRYSGAPLAPLAALDRSERVIYIGTFGKVAFPALRLGYLVLPQALASAFAQRRAIDMRHSEVASQWVMARFMAQGHFQRHIRRMRKAALGRRNALLALWPHGVAGCSPIPQVSAGLHVKIDVAGVAREAQLVSLAELAAVDIQPLSSYWLEAADVPVDKRAGLVLGFAGVNEAEIASAVGRLRTAWRVS